MGHWYQFLVYRKDVLVFATVDKWFADGMQYKFEEFLKKRFPESEGFKIELKIK
jgi:hypothetical protein